MVLTQSTKAHLESMVTSKDFADGIECRLALTTPASAAAAQARFEDSLEWGMAKNGLCSDAAVDEFKAAYNAMIVAIQATT